MPSEDMSSAFNKFTVLRYGKKKKPRISQLKLWRVVVIWCFFLFFDFL